MFDALALFDSAKTMTSTENSDVVSTYKTPGDGVWIEVAVTAASGTSPTLNITVYEGPVAFGSSQLIGTIPEITAVGNYYIRVQSKLDALRLTYTIAGTSPSFTVTAGIVAAPDRNRTA